MSPKGKEDSVQLTIRAQRGAARALRGRGLHQAPLFTTPANNSHHPAEPVPELIVSSSLRVQQHVINQGLAYMLHQTLQLLPYAPYACTIVRSAHHNQTPWVWR